MHRLFFFLALGSALGLANGCRTVEPADPFPAQVGGVELDVLQQDFLDLHARVSFDVRSLPGARVRQAHVEILLDGELLTSTEQPIRGNTVGPDGHTSVVLDEPLRYVPDTSKLEALEKRRTLKLTLRGTVLLEKDEQTREAAYTRTREIRAPKLLVPRVQSVNAGRYGNGEINVVFKLVVENPNPFPVRLRSVRYALGITDQQVGDGVVGQADELAANGSGVFEVTQFLDQSFEELDQRLVSMGSIPFAFTGTLAAEPYARNFQVKGSFHLTDAR